MNRYKKEIYLLEILYWTKKVMLVDLQLEKLKQIKVK